jgi:hypothetical protein
MDVEQRARELLAAEWDKCGGAGQNVATGIRAGASLPMDLPAIRAIIAALTPPEGYVIVPVGTQKDAERFQWLKKCSREQYLLARGMFGLADDVIDAVIRDEAKEASNGK